MKKIQCYLKEAAECLKSGGRIWNSDGHEVYNNSEWTKEGNLFITLNEAISPVWTIEWPEPEKETRQNNQRSDKALSKLSDTTSEVIKLLNNVQVNLLTPQEITQIEAMYQPMGRIVIELNSINANNNGVHARHCCIRHGCKYGDADCPVVNGKIVQTHLCQDCLNENAISLKK